MTTMQEKILAKIEEKITAAGLDVSYQRQYANTGHLYADKDFDVLLDLDYSFQDGHCSLLFSGPLVLGSGLEDSPPIYRVETNQTRTKVVLAWHYLRYVESPRVKGMLDVVGGILPIPVS